MAKIEADRVNEPSETPTMAGRLNSARSSIGSFCLHSPTMKTAMSTTEATSMDTMYVLPHPLSLPCTRA